MRNDIKFQTDEHIPSAVISGLQRRGIDVLSTPQAGLLGATDADQLACATQQQRVMVTQDDDFLSLHAQGDGENFVTVKAKVMIKFLESLGFELIR